MKNACIKGKENPPLGGGGGLHCEKRLAIFPSPAGMALTKLSMAGNVYSAITDASRQFAIPAVNLRPLHSYNSLVGKARENRITWGAHFYALPIPSWRKPTVYSIFLLYSISPIILQIYRSCLGLSRRGLLRLQNIHYCTERMSDVAIMGKLC